MPKKSGWDSLETGALSDADVARTYAAAEGGGSIPDEFTAAPVAVQNMTHRARMMDAMKRLGVLEMQAPDPRPKAGGQVLRFDGDFVRQPDGSLKLIRKNERYEDR